MTWLTSGAPESAPIALSICRSPPPAVGGYPLSPCNSPVMTVQRRVTWSRVAWRERQALWVRALGIMIKMPSSTT